MMPPPTMETARSFSPRALHSAMGAAVLLLVVALGVRGIRAEVPPLPEDVPGEEPTLAEPQQLLARGAELRLRELSGYVDPGRRALWDACHRMPFDLEGCPKLLEWVDGPDGQRFEQLLGELRRGSSEEALAGLALVFQLGRTTKWSPGFRTGTQHAERLAGLLQDWLRVWAEPSASDPVLYEPALGAALLYGRIMRIAYNNPTIGRNEAPYERAKAFLLELTGTGEGARLTDFGQRLQARYPAAFEAMTGKSDFLKGFNTEAKLLFPDLDGECKG